LTRVCGASLEVTGFSMGKMMLVCPGVDYNTEHGI